MSKSETTEGSSSGDNQTGKWASASDPVYRVDLLPKQTNKTWFTNAL